MQAGLLALPSNAVWVLFGVLDPAEEVATAPESTRDPGDAARREDRVVEAAREHDNNIQSWRSS